jgi:hypothetical protein
MGFLVKIAKAITHISMLIDLWTGNPTGAALLLAETILNKEPCCAAAIRR